MPEYVYPCLTRLYESIVTGRFFALQDARRCLAAGLRAEPVEEMLLDLSMVLDGGDLHPDQGTADRLGLDDRLRSILALLDESPVGVTPQPGERVASIALATLPGDRDTVARLSRLVLAGRGYGVHSLGVKAAPVVASHVAELASDALVLHVSAPRTRTAVQALVANLVRKGARVPLLIGGPGVDAEFAQWVAIPDGSRPYWGGVYYCDSLREMLQVLQQVILFEPPPAADHHDGEKLPQESATGCNGCPLATSCDPK